MTTRRNNAEIKRLLNIPGATIQTDRVKTRRVKLPKKPRKKRKPTEKQAQKNEDEQIIGALPVGRTSIKLEKEKL